MCNIVLILKTVSSITHSVFWGRPFSFPEDMSFIYILLPWWGSLQLREPLDGVLTGCHGTRSEEPCTVDSSEVRESHLGFREVTAAISWGRLKLSE